MTKSKKLGIRKDRDRIFVAAVAVITMLVLLTVMSARISRFYQTDSHIIDVDVTPVVNQPAKDGWRTFSHPDYKFTFKYPADWAVALTKSNVRDRGYNLLLTYSVRGTEKRVEFLRGGRGAPASDSIDRDTRDYGGHTGYKSTYVKRGLPFQEVITFRDPHILDPYIAIEAQLPATDTTKYEKLLDTIAASVARAK